METLMALAVLSLVWITLKGDLRMWVTVTVAIVAWTVARMPDFPGAAVVLSLVPIFGMAIIISALMHTRDEEAPPNPRITWLLPIAAFASVMFVQTTVDAGAATYQRLTWALTVLAAVMVAGRLNDERDLKNFLTSIAAAGFIVLGIYGVSFAQNPAAALGGDYTRYAAWGGNPNAAGPVLVSGTGALLALGLRSGALLRALSFVGAGGTLFFLILTSSRGNLLLLACVAVPVIVISAWKRPVVAVSVIAVGIYVLNMVVSRVSGSRFDRLDSLQDEARAGLARAYFEEAMDRPFFGLMFSQYERHQTMVGYDLDEHNAYLRLFYLGGLALLLPVVVVLVTSLMSGVRLLRASKGSDEFVFWVFLFFLYVGILGHSFTVRLMVEPFGVWAFLFPALSVLLIKFYRLKKAHALPVELPVAR